MLFMLQLLTHQNGKSLSERILFAGISLRLRGGFSKYSYASWASVQPRLETLPLASNQVLTGELVTSFPLTLGLYSAFLARSAMVFRSSLQPRFTVDTIFLKMS